jgi:hypothetical protein
VIFFFTTYPSNPRKKWINFCYLFETRSHFVPQTACNSTSSCLSSAGITGVHHHARLRVWVNFVHHCTPAEESNNGSSLWHIWDLGSEEQVLLEVEVLSHRGEPVIHVRGARARSPRQRPSSARVRETQADPQHFLFPGTQVVFWIFKRIDDSREAMFNWRQSFSSFKINVHTF